MTKKISWTIALLLLFISTVVSPYISKLIRGYFGLLFLIIFSLSGIFIGFYRNYFANSIYRGYIINSKMFFLLIWFIFGVSISYFNGADDISYLIGVFFLPVFFLLGTFLSIHLEYRYFTTNVILLFVLINILLTGMSIGIEESARQIYIESSHDLVAGTTSFWGLIATFFPLFILSTKNLNSIIFKIIYIIVIVFVLYKLLFSGFATPIGLFFINIMIIIGLYLFYRRNFQSLFFLFLSLILVYLIINIILFSDIQALSSVKFRFANFLLDPTGGGYDQDTGISRFLPMQFSWKSFITHPIFGVGGNIRTSIEYGLSGGHSSFVDLLAVLGIFGGGGAFVLFVYKAFKNSLRSMKYTPDIINISNFSVVITFIIGGIMNPYWSGPYLVSFLLIANIYNDLLIVDMNNNE